MTSLRTRRASPILALIVSLAGVVAGGPGGPAEVRAATPDLTIVGAARYDVQPARQRVRVTVDLTLVNRLKDTTTKRYFFDHAFLAVLPGSSGHRLSWAGSGRPTVRVARSTKTHTLLRLDLARDLASGKSAKYRLTFDLKDPGGRRATRDLRIGETLVSFPVWAFASDDTPGGSVSVVFPKGYQVHVEAGSIPRPTTLADGRTVFRSGTLSKPLDFFAYLVGDRAGAYQERSVDVTVHGRPVEITVRAWADDPAWAARVSGLLRKVLPVLGDDIGLPWPAYDQPLIVEEAVSRSTGGYAGIFDPGEGKVAIAYYADDFVVVHEAAHAWFNGVLLADRWSNEAFASYYGALAADQAKIPVATDRLTDELEKARIPLNAWGPVGTNEVAQEDYAYAAALTLARQVAERAGAQGLKAVWADAADRISAYQPLGGGDEVVPGPVDWRGLLDLLEARSDATYDDLWRTWVARPEDLPLLDARRAARARYDALLTRVRDWDVPLSIRDAMRAWRFDEATELMDRAGAALQLRGRVEAAVDAAGLTAPPGLRDAFEDDDGFDDAIAEGGAELQAVERFTAATARRPAALTPLMALGLWGDTPDAELAAAKEAFARGDLQASAVASDEAAASWANAESLGLSRAFSLAMIGLALLFTLSLIVVNLRRRHGRRLRSQARRARA